MEDQKEALTTQLNETVAREGEAVKLTTELQRDLLSYDMSRMVRGWCKVASSDWCVAMQDESEVCVQMLCELRSLSTEDADAQVSELKLSSVLQQKLMVPNIKYQILDIYIEYQILYNKS